MNQITARIVNSLLAGSLVFLGACTNGEITKGALFAAGIASLIVAVTQFKDFWSSYELTKKQAKAKDCYDVKEPIKIGSFFPLV